MLVAGAALTAAVTCLLHARATIVTHWRLWQTVQSWQTSGSFSTLKRRMLACRTQTRKGTWGVLNALQLLASTKREQACLVMQVLKTRQEHEVFTRKFLAVVLCLLFCLHVGAVLFLWWQWTRRQGEMLQQEAAKTVEQSVRKPFFKRLKSKWRKHSLRSKLKRPKLYLYKRQIKYLKNRMGNTRLQDSIGNVEDELMKDLDRYMITTRRKAHTRLLKDVMAEAVRVFWLVTVKSLRRVLRLGSKPGRGSGRTVSQRKYL